MIRYGIVLLLVSTLGFGAEKGETPKRPEKPIPEKEKEKNEKKKRHMHIDMTPEPGAPKFMYRRLI